MDSPPVSSTSPGAAGARATDGVPHERTAPSPELVAAAQALVRERLRFGVPVAAISLGAYLAIAALTGFTDVLEVPVAGRASLALVLLALLVPLVWGLALVYRRRADRWDASSAAVRIAATATVSR